VKSELLGSLVQFGPEFLVECGSVLNFASVVVNSGIAVQTGEICGVGNLKRSECIHNHEKSELGTAALLAEHVLVEQEVRAKEDD
jgi:hypothetical protein